MNTECVLKALYSAVPREQSDGVPNSDAASQLKVESVYPYTLSRLATGEGTNNVRLSGHRFYFAKII
jgi:hypothetical protein